MHGLIAQPVPIADNEEKKPGKGGLLGNLVGGALDLGGAAAGAALDVGEAGADAVHDFFNNGKGTIEKCDQNSVIAPKC